MTNGDTRSRFRIWGDRIVTGLITTALVLGSAVLISIPASKSQNELAARIDRNADVSQRGVNAIICILQLGVDSDAPPRSQLNVDRCLRAAGWTTAFDIPKGG